jgi:glycosyltransferase involved in cell wall biosynthesis
MYNYSVIIPHKNIPDLLQRCLDSIPQRDDLQVIVIDDNSDAKLVDFDNFPGRNRPNTEIIFSKGDKGKGPGYARNVGISKAKSKWIIFSDADDYFIEIFNSLLDKYQESDEDIIFFKCSRQNKNGEIAEEYPLFNDAIDSAIKTGDTDSIVYGVPSPVAKMIRLDFIESHHIRYQEITGGDDILFSIRMAVNQNKIKLCEDKIYCVVDRPGSLTRNNNWKGFYSYVLACCEAYTLLKPVSKENLAVNWTSIWWGALWAENIFVAAYIVPKIYWLMGFRRATSCIRKGMKRGARNWNEH